MAASFDLVASRLRNMLTRIDAADSGFQDLCNRHAELTSDIRRLNNMADPTHAQHDDELRRRSAQLEQEKIAINTAKHPMRKVAVFSLTQPPAAATTVTHV